MLTPAPPPEEWVFLPPTVQPPNASAPQPPPHLPAPSPFGPDDADDDDLGLPGGVQLIGAQFFVAALGMPFEVGKTLLQVSLSARRCRLTVGRSSVAGYRRFPSESPLRRAAARDARVHDMS